VNNGSGSTLLGTSIVQNVAPSLFSADASGTGVAAAVALGVSGNQQTVIPAFQCSGPTCSALPIDLSAADSVYLILYGTGVRHHANPVVCSINGTSVPVQYAGAQTTYQGLDQINVGPLPASLAGSGNVTVALTVDGIAANAVTVDFR
jgi:uncharacterized protein (TIGR03437 family)